MPIQNYFFVCSGSVGLMEANPTGCQKNPVACDLGSSRKSWGNMYKLLVGDTSNFKWA